LSYVWEIMEQINWKDEKYSVGNDEFDQAHKKLISLINQLYIYINEGVVREKINDILEQLTIYAKEHFSNEELLMMNKDYPDLAAHQLEHKLFISELAKLHDKYRNNKNLVSVQLLYFLKDWLISHILHTDKKYATYFKHSS